MQGTITKSGVVTFIFDTQVEKLLSPDGTQQCLPCETCGEPQWVSLPTCSVVCDRCALAWSQTDPELEVCTPHPESVACVCGINVHAGGKHED
jgi:hypothetical protein